MVGFENWSKCEFVETAAWAHPWLTLGEQLVAIYLALCACAPPFTDVGISVGAWIDTQLVI